MRNDHHASPSHGAISQASGIAEGSPHTRRRQPIRALALLLLLSAVMGFGMQIWQGLSIRQLLGDRPPELFYRALEPQLLDDYGNVIGIAHNAGNSAVAIALARRAGADGIEIDVNVLDDSLYASHTSIPVWIGDPSTQPIHLDTAWTATDGVPFVQFDFKGTAPRDLERFFAWLGETRPNGRQVAVSARPLAVLETLREIAPEPMRLLSIGTASELLAFQIDEDAPQLVDGVTVNERLLDAETVGWLKERDLFVVAWTVNRITRVNELVALGVDAITTDNLAILELLSATLIEEDAPLPPPEATPQVELGTGD